MVERRSWAEYREAHGITPAEELLEKYRGQWKGSVESIFDEYAY